jgi:hypothetical protein
MTRARNLGKLANQNSLSADNTNNFVGIGSTQPDARLDVDGTVLVGTAITIGGASGIVSATAFYGDGSNLDGVASAGLGTALAEEGAGSVIYYTDAVLGIGSTVIVSVPSTTSDVAYTQYATVSVDGDADLIVAEDDDFIADILGIGSDVQTPGTLTNNSRVRAARLANSAGTGAPQLQFGAEVPVGYGITGAGGINITGVATAGSFVGNVTGNADTATIATNAQGLTGTPDVTVNNITGVAATFTGTLTYEDVTNIDAVGIITAQSGIKVLGAGVTVSGIATFHNGADFNGLLKETIKITAGKLSDNLNINLDNGMVHYFTTEETTTSTPNIMSGTGINTALAVGDTLSVTIGITTGSYAARVSIDGNLTGITTYWNGGSAPDAAGDTGKDIYTYQIIKTASETYDVLANVSNFA